MPDILPPQDFREYLSRQEARLARAERNGQQSGTSLDALGLGYGAACTELNDWNSDEVTVNGFFWSDFGALNTPDNFSQWIGTSQVTDDNKQGIQQISSLTDPPYNYVRTWYDPRLTEDPDDGWTRVYTSWALVMTSASGANVITGAQTDDTQASITSTLAGPGTSSTDGDHAIAIGDGATASNDDAVSVGTDSEAAGQRGIAAGVQANARGIDGIAVGHQAISESGMAAATAIGKQAYAGRDDSVAIGPFAGVGAGGANGDYGTAVGKGASVTEDGGTALGVAAEATGASGIAIGDTAKAEDDNATAIGRLADAASEKAIAIGDSALALTSPSGTAIGDGASVNGAPFGLALGANTDVGADGAVGIGCDSAGDGALATGVDDFILGTANHKVKVPGLFGVHGHAAVAQSAAPVTADDLSDILSNHGLSLPRAGSIDTPPSGPAGGVLAGTYPNPSFAADMATQAELDAIVIDSIADGDATHAPSRNAVFDALAAKASKAQAVGYALVFGGM